MINDGHRSPESSGNGLNFHCDVTDEDSKPSHAPPEMLVHTRTLRSLGIQPYLPGKYLNVPNPDFPLLYNRAHICGGSVQPGRPIDRLRNGHQIHRGRGTVNGMGRCSHRRSLGNRSDVAEKAPEGIARTSPRFTIMSQCEAEDRATSTRACERGDPLRSKKPAKRPLLIASEDAGRDSKFDGIRELVWSYRCCSKEPGSHLYRWPEIHSFTKEIDPLRNRYFESIHGKRNTDGLCETP